MTTPSAYSNSACMTLTRSNPSGYAFFEQDLLAPLDGSERLNVRVTDALDVEWECTVQDAFASFADGTFQLDEPVGRGAMDTTFHLPKDRWPESYGLAHGKPLPEGYHKQLVHPFRVDA